MPDPEGLVREGVIFQHHALPDLGEADGARRHVQHDERVRPRVPDRREHLIGGDGSADLDEQAGHLPVDRGHDVEAGLRGEAGELRFDRAQFVAHGGELALLLRHHGPLGATALGRLLAHLGPARPQLGHLAAVLQKRAALRVEGIPRRVALVEIGLDAFDHRALLAQPLAQDHLLPVEGDRDGVHVGVDLRPLAATLRQEGGQAIAFAVEHPAPLDEALPLGRDRGDAAGEALVELHLQQPLAAPHRLALANIDRRDDSGSARVEPRESGDSRDVAAHGFGAGEVPEEEGRNDDDDHQPEEPCQGRRSAVAMQVKGAGPPLEKAGRCLRRAVLAHAAPPRGTGSPAAGRNSGRRAQWCHCSGQVRTVASM